MQQGLSKKIGRASLEALTVQPLCQRNIFVAVVVEALPFSVPSNLAGGTGDTSVDEITQCN
jgi:hypothetical protein